MGRIARKTAARIVAAPKDRDEADARLAREAWEEARRDPGSVVPEEAFVREVHARNPRAVPPELRRRIALTPRRRAR